MPSIATVDTDREARCGFPEVIFGEGKSAETIAGIARQLVERKQEVLVTRVDAAKAVQLEQLLPESRYNAVGRTLRIDFASRDSGGDRGRVAVITAGTSDLPVAEEARDTLEWMGVEVTMVHDVGVAGPHRLPARLAEFAGCGDCRGADADRFLQQMVRMAAEDQIESVDG